MEVSKDAGKIATPATLVNVPKLVTDYFAEIPDPSVQDIYQTSVSAKRPARITLRELCQTSLAFQFPLKLF